MSSLGAPSSPISQRTLFIAVVVFAILLAFNWLLAIGFAIAAPTIVSIFGACLYFTRNHRERLVFVVMGCFGVLVTVFAWPSGVPGSWWDENLNVLVVCLAPFGALAASIVSVAILRCISRSPGVAAQGCAADASAAADSRENLPSRDPP
jgi:hypothetical protein